MEETLADIQTRTDIERFVEFFYQGLLDDPVMNPIFTRVAQIDLSHHLPIICDFWESVLFQTKSYRRNTMLTHLNLNKQFRLEKYHFDLWIHHFNEAMDALFVGPKADYAKERALSIATIIQIKIYEDLHSD